MSKRIVGEDGKTYVQKKPFYKRVWFILLALIVVFAIFASLGSSDETTDSSSDQKSSTQSKTTSSTAKVEKKVVSQATFDKLKVGDLASNGAGGTSYADVVALLGKPTTTSQSSVQGQDVEMDAWNNLGGDFTAISLSFGGKGDQRALSSKSITYAKNVLSSKEISQADFDAITTDGTMPLSDVIAKLGKPAQITVTSIMGVETKTDVWTNINSSFGSGMTLTVSGGDTIIGKTKTETK